MVHEDDDVIVVDKPPGLITANMPGEDRESLFDLVKEHVRAGKRRARRVWIIHRLDKEASGLLVFAKSERAFQWLKEDLRARRMHRLYLAVVEGEIRHEDERLNKDAAAAESDPDATASLQSTTPRRFRQPPSGTIQSFIRDDEFGNVTSVGIGDVARESVRTRAGRRPPEASRFKGGSDEGAPRLAVTHWRVIAAGHGRSLLQLRLETGRKNQIRVHMQQFGHPIIGDHRYGATTDPIRRLALHAAELGFTHPATGQTARFHSPAPASFYRAVGAPVPSGAGEDAPPPPAPAEESPEQPVASPDDAVGPPQGTAEVPAAPSAAPLPAAETSWDQVAEWYDSLMEEERSDHFRHVIIPGTLRLLRPPTEGGMRILDIACGQGALARTMAAQGLNVLGVDASPRLVEAARQRAQRAGVPARFEIGDARALGEIDPGVLGGPFDAATCVMALMNIDPLEPVMGGAAALLRPGGAFVAVILHPAFRAPGQTSWGWEEERPPRRGRDDRPARGRVRQFRRIDGYLSPGQMPIVMNPGRAAHGAAPVTTWTFHRPLQTYIRALAEAGFLVEALEEWPSMRTSQPGPRAAEENRARREIPMFLGLRAVKASR